mgnify:CR=1 FL=1
MTKFTEEYDSTKDEENEKIDTSISENNISLYVGNFLNNLSDDELLQYQHFSWDRIRIMRHLRSISNNKRLLEVIAEIGLLVALYSNSRKKIENRMLPKVKKTVNEVINSFSILSWTIDSPHTLTPQRCLLLFANEVNILLSQRQGRIPPHSSGVPISLCSPAFISLPLHTDARRSHEIFMSHFQRSIGADRPNDDIKRQQENNVAMWSWMEVYRMSYYSEDTVSLPEYHQLVKTTLRLDDDKALMHINKTSEALAGSETFTPLTRYSSTDFEEYILTVLEPRRISAGTSKGKSTKAKPAKPPATTPSSGSTTTTTPPSKTST